MKYTSDNKEVPDRCWQYLRSFHLWIRDLTFDEFWKYFATVIKRELQQTLRSPLIEENN